MWQIRPLFNNFERYLTMQGLRPAPAHDDDASQNETAPSPQLCESDVEVSDMDDDEFFFDDGDGNEVNARDLPEYWWERTHVKKHKAMRKIAALFSCKFVPAQTMGRCMFTFQPDDATGSFPTSGRRAEFYNNSRSIYWIYGAHGVGKNWFKDMFVAALKALPSQECMVINMVPDGQQNYLTVNRVINNMNTKYKDAQMAVHKANGGDANDFTMRTKFLLVVVPLNKDQSEQLNVKDNRTRTTLKKRILGFAEDLQSQFLTTTMFGGCEMQTESTRLLVVCNHAPIEDGENFSFVGADRLADSVFELRNDRTTNCVDFKKCVESNDLLEAAAEEQRRQAERDEQQRRDQRAKRPKHGPMPTTPREKFLWWMRNNNKVFADLDAPLQPEKWMLLDNLMNVCQDRLKLTGIVFKGRGYTLRAALQDWFGDRCRLQRYGTDKWLVVNIVDAPPPAADPKVSPGEDGPAVGPDSAGPSVSAGPADSAGPSDSAGPAVSVGPSETAV